MFDLLNDAAALFRPTTPKDILPAISELCRSITPGAKPLFLEVNAQEGARFGECFANVQKMITKHGGGKQHGWLIWERPGIFVEAEFHCVWETNEGELFDVSPRQDGEEVVLFLPDSARRFDGRPVPNKRKALTNDPLVSRFLKSRDKIDKCRRRTYRDGRFTMPPAMLLEALEIDVLMVERYGKS